MVSTPRRRSTSATVNDSASERRRAQLAIKPNGYLVAEPNSTRTAIPGVFACGAVVDDYYRQAITAPGSGCMAAIDAELWLETLHD